MPHRPVGILILLAMVPAVAEQPETLEERTHDSLTLNNGTVFHGTIEAENEQEVLMVMKDSPMKLRFKKGGEAAENVKEVTRRFSKEDSYRKESEAAGDDPKKHFRLAGKCRNSGLIREVEVELRRAIELDPKYLEACRKQAAHYRDAGDLEGEFRVCRDATKQELADNELQLRLAEIYLQLGLPAFAVRELQEIRKRAPDMAPAMVREADALRLMGKKEEALKIYAEALSKSPKQSDALYGRGMLAFEVGQFAIAREVFQATLAGKPDFHEARFRLSLTHLALGEPTEALNLLSKMPPDHSLTYFVLLNEAIAEAASGSPARAQGILDQLPEAEPGSYKKIVQAFVYEHLGEADAPARALTAYEEAVKELPEGALALVGFGRALAATGKTDLALESMRKAERAAPDFWPAHLAEGLALLDSGQPEKGATRLIKAKDLQVAASGAKDADLLFAVGHAWLSSGKLEEAKRFLESALEADAKHKAAIAGMKEILRRQANPVKSEQKRPETPAEKSSLPEEPPLPEAGVSEKSGKKAVPAETVEKPAAATHEGLGDGKEQASEEKPETGPSTGEAYESLAATTIAALRQKGSRICWIVEMPVRIKPKEPSKDGAMRGIPKAER